MHRCAFPKGQITRQPALNRPVGQGSSIVDSYRSNLAQNGKKCSTPLCVVPARPAWESQPARIRASAMYGQVTPWQKNQGRKAG